MDDLISRKEVIKAIEDEWDGCLGEYNSACIIRDTCEAIDRVASAHPEIKTGRWISEQDMTDKLTRLINEFEMIMSDIREKEVDDCVCGLCEYDADHGMDGYANECPGYEKDDCFRLKDEYRKQWMSMKW